MGTLALEKKSTNEYVVSGEIALDGSNPTPIVTGFGTVTGVAVALKNASTPGVGTSIITYDISGGTVNLNAWKVTSSSVTTLIASTGTETVGYVITGY